MNSLSILSCHTHKFSIFRNGKHNHDSQLLNFSHFSQKCDKSAFDSIIATEIIKEYGRFRTLWKLSIFYSSCLFAYISIGLASQKMPLSFNAWDILAAGAKLGNVKLSCHYLNKMLNSIGNCFL